MPEAMLVVSLCGAKRLFACVLGISVLLVPSRYGCMSHLVACSFARAFALPEAMLVVSLCCAKRCSACDLGLSVFAWSHRVMDVRFTLPRAVSSASWCLRHGVACADVLTLPMVVCPSTHWRDSHCVFVVRVRASSH